MKCFIIVVKDGEDEPYMLSTRKTFDTFEDAEKHVKGYSEYYQKFCLIVECPKGLTY